MYPNNNTDTHEKSTEEIFVDHQKNGKARPWREKKLSTISYYELLHLLEFKKSERVRDCGSVLEFSADGEGYLKLAKAYFCKSPLCSMCNWRRAMKHSSQTKRIVAEVVKRKPNAKWLFLTLSVRNAIDGETLDQSLRDMSEGFNRLFKYKKVAKNLVGFMRATEVTVNEKDGTYNQHMHVLICVESSYFKNTENYISAKQWREFWQKAMKLNYLPVVNIQTVKAKNNKKSDLHSAIDETAKYPVKASDYLTDDQEHNLMVVKDLEKGLHRKRRIAYGGLLKELHKELNLDNPEDGDLVKTGDDEQEISEEAYRVVAYWNWRRSDFYYGDKKPKK
ncbi:protein rep [Exiguobacterium oxidotolerans]|uniref:Protein rep n=1 Tax=Exiguobacterium oxidotolerans TaxID=223958 RepID=A0A653IHU9_9BACL|nr:protein rep [Exiguobacterium oxidotolerans]VWX38609.1 Protein rep [Exiguobacterium oxidotolerans]